MAYIAWLTHQDNSAPEATLTVTTAESGYPASNLQSTPVTETWRSTSVASAQDIEIDLGSAQAVDIITLVNHNLTSAATIAIAAGTTSAVADYSNTMTYREFMAFLWLSSAETYRYWRVRITDTANSDGYIEMGYLAIGDSTTPDFNFQYGWVQAPIFDNQEIASPYGVPFVAEMFRVQRLRLSFGPLTSSEMTTLRSLYTTLKRDANPLVLLPERDGSNGYFGRIINAFDERIEAQRYTNMEFIEDGYGKRI